MLEHACAVLLLPDGRWVLQRRTDDAPADPSVLSFFGGAIEAGETPEVAVVRELGEETDLKLKPAGGYAMMCEPIAGRRNGKELKLHVFKVEITSLKFKVFEGVRAEAYSVAELQTRPDISEVVKTAIKKVKDKHGA